MAHDDHAAWFAPEYGDEIAALAARMSTQDIAAERRDAARLAQSAAEGNLATHEPDAPDVCRFGMFHTGPCADGDTDEA